MFWCAFTLIVVVALFSYGMNLIREDTLLARADRALKENTRSITRLTEENYALTAQIAMLKQRLDNQQKVLGETEIQLTNQISEVQRQDELIASLNGKLKDRQEPFHPYGKQHAKLTIYRSCQCSELKVWIDGEFVGTATVTLSPGTARCGSPGAVTSVILSGKHHIIASDSANKRWDFYTTTNEDACSVHGLSAGG